VAVLPRVKTFKFVPPIVLSIGMGQYAMASAVPVDSAGDLLGDVVTWTVADSTVVKVTVPFQGVSNAAEIVAVAPGTTVVTASVGTVATRATVTVTPADTTLLSWLVGGVQVPSQPLLRHFTLPITLTLFNRPCYTVNFTAPGIDSVVATTLACIRKP